MEKISMMRWEVQTKHVNYSSLAFFPHTSSFKLLQIRIETYGKQNAKCQADLGKGRGTWDPKANNNKNGLIKKARKLEGSLVTFVDYSKAFACVNHA